MPNGEAMVWPGVANALLSVVASDLRMHFPWWARESLNLPIVETFSDEVFPVLSHGGIPDDIRAALHTGHGRRIGFLVVSHPGASEAAASLAFVKSAFSYTRVSAVMAHMQLGRAGGLDCPGIPSARMGRAIVTDGLIRAWSLLGSIPPGYYRLKELFSWLRTLSEEYPGLGSDIFPRPSYVQQSTLFSAMSSSPYVGGYTPTPLIGLWHDSHSKKLDWRTLKSFLEKMARGIEAHIDDLICWWGRLRSSANRIGYLAHVSERSFDAAIRHLNSQGHLLADIPATDSPTHSTPSPSSSSSCSFTPVHEPVSVGRAASAFAPWPN